MTDYYEILGVAKDVSQDDLKAAYRKLSMRFHPDRQAGKTDAEKKEAEEKFKEINAAYSVLSDPEKRRNYDQFGTADGFGKAGGGGFEGFNPMDFFRKMHAGFGFGDFDGDSFGFNMGSSGRNSAPDINSPENGDDVQTKISVTFKESITGCIKEFDFDLDRECPVCHGTGAKAGSKPDKCKRCHGRGRLVQVKSMGPMVTQQITVCPDCSGTGYSIEPCEHCHGNKTVAEKRHVKVKVPAGFQDGQQLRLKGLGRCGLKGGENGNLYVIVRVQESELFERDDYNNISVNVFVSPTVATFGGKVEVPTPYGYKYVKISPGTNSGTRLHVPGAGIKSNSGTGDMIIDVFVEPYKDITPEQKELLEKLQKTEKISNFAHAEELKRAAEEFYK